MTDFYQSRHVAKTRKDQYCYDCGHKIPSGSEAHKSCTMLDGSFLHGYFCYTCVPNKYPKEADTHA